MEESSTERFFRLMNEANERIAADEEAKQEPSEVGDPVRIQRMEERRQRLGQLRARPHARSKTRKVHSVFPYVDPQ